MRQRHLLAAALTSVIIAALPVFLGSARAQRGASAGHHVVIISLDGFTGDAMADASLPVPTLRKLAARGAVAAKGMRPVNPTVTWPNHTSMVTGVHPAKHGVLFNGLLVRQPGLAPRIEPWRDKSEMVRARTLYDIAHARGLTTAQVDWVAIQNPGTITWEFGERPNPEGRVARELVAAGVLTEDDLANFAGRNIVYRDHIWTQAAAHIIRTHRPNLMLFHLLNLDSTQHRYGPRTHAATSAMALLDTQVAEILRAVEDAGLTARTTVFVVSDHGFKAVKRQIRPNAAFARAGLLTAQEGKVVKADVYSVPEAGTALVYVTKEDPGGELLARARKALEGLEGIERVIEPKEYAELGLPRPAESDQAGALFLTARDGYAFTADPGEPAVVDAPPGSGSHGYVASDPDLRALFIASGRGIREGVTLDTVNTVDIAPTAATLLDLELKAVDGRALKQILR